MAVVVAVLPILVLKNNYYPLLKRIMLRNLLWLQVAAVEIVMIIQVDVVVEILLEHVRHIEKVLGWLLIMMLMVILLVRKIQMYHLGITLAMEYQE